MRVCGEVVIMLVSRTSVGGSIPSMPIYKMELKKIKDLSQDDGIELAKLFTLAQTVRIGEVPKILTSSEELQRKTRFIDCASGAHLIEMSLYRQDIKDEAKGFPINVDKYFIYRTEPLSMFKVQPPFLGHWRNQL